MKKARDPVFAATINQTGGLEVRVTKLAKDSTIEKLIRMAEESQNEKAETQRASALDFSLPLTVGVAGHEGLPKWIAPAHLSGKNWIVAFAGFRSFIGVKVFALDIPGSQSFSNSNPLCPATDANRPKQ